MSDHLINYMNTAFEEGKNGAWQFVDFELSPWYRRGTSRASRGYWKTYTTLI